MADRHFRTACSALYAAPCLSGQRAQPYDLRCPVAPLLARWPHCSLIPLQQRIDLCAGRERNKMTTSSLLYDSNILGFVGRDVELDALLGKLVLFFFFFFLGHRTDYYMNSQSMQFCLCRSPPVYWLSLSPLSGRGSEAVRRHRLQLVRDGVQRRQPRGQFPTHTVPPALHRHHQICGKNMSPLLPPLRIQGLFNWMKSHF